MKDVKDSIAGTSSEDVLGKNIRQRKFNWKLYFPYFLLGGMVLVFTLINGNFLSLNNLAGIMKQTGCVSIIAFGMIFIITAGEIDLSVGSTLGLTGLVASTAITNWGFNYITASLIALGLGLVIGLLNGLMVAQFKLTAFLATLATANVVRGVALTITSRMAVVVYDQKFLNLWGSGDFLPGVPRILIWVAITFVVMGFLYHYSPFGNHVRATGGNRVAAQYTGIKTKRVLISSFAFTSVLASIAGLIMVTRLGVGRPETGTGYELDSIAAVVLGGTSMSGGSGTLVGAIIGSLIMGVIINGLTILGLDANYQQIVKGLIIVLAISINRN